MQSLIISGEIFFRERLQDYCNKFQAEEMSESLPKTIFNMI